MIVVRHFQECSERLCDFIQRFPIGVVEEIDPRYRVFIFNDQIDLERSRIDGFATMLSGDELNATHAIEWQRTAFGVEESLKGHRLIVLAESNSDSKLFGNKVSDDQPARTKQRKDDRTDKELPRPAKMPANEYRDRNRCKKPDRSPEVVSRWFKRDHTSGLTLQLVDVVIGSDSMR